MRLGLLADIHEAVERLAAAIRELQARRVDAFVMLGDVLDTGDRAEETVALLADLPGLGLWGNHDFGLCGIPPEAAGGFSSAVVAYFNRLRPWAEIEGRHFQHIDPHLDPERFEHLWDMPTPEQRIAEFARCAHDRVFMGHLHRWAICTPDGYLPWDPGTPFQYTRGERYLTVVHAVTDGWCAVLDTDDDRLEPVRVTDI